MTSDADRFPRFSDGLVWSESGAKRRLVAMPRCEPEPGRWVCTRFLDPLAAEVAAQDMGQSDRQSAEKAAEFVGTHASTCFSVLLLVHSEDGTSEGAFLSSWGRRRVPVSARNASQLLDNEDCAIVLIAKDDVFASFEVQIQLQSKTLMEYADKVADLWRRVEGPTDGRLRAAAEQSCKRLRAALQA